MCRARETIGQLVTCVRGPRVRADAAGLAEPACRTNGPVVQTTCDWALRDVLLLYSADNAEYAVYQKMTRGHLVE
jgi:hypothetical protein